VSDLVKCGVMAVIAISELTEGGGYHMETIGLTLILTLTQVNSAKRRETSQAAIRLICEDPALTTYNEEQTARD
jgi:hypothetical protein